MNAKENEPAKKPDAKSEETQVLILIRWTFAGPEEVTAYAASVLVSCAVIFLRKVLSQRCVCAIDGYAFSPLHSFSVQGPRSLRHLD